MIIYDDDGIGHEVVPISVLEDIKAEIKSHDNKERYPYGVISVFTALQIIDKYIKECD